MFSTVKSPNENLNSNPKTFQAEHFRPQSCCLVQSSIFQGYRCLPNMGAQVRKHNNKILNNANKKQSNRTPPSCNCIKSKKNECPLPGECNQQGVIYQATVENKKGEKETYIGLAAKFKARFYKHRQSMEVQNPENSTTLSTHFWDQVTNIGKVWKFKIQKIQPPFQPTFGTK